MLGKFFEDRIATCIWGLSDMDALGDKIGLTGGAVKAWLSNSKGAYIAAEQVLENEGVVFKSFRHDWKNRGPKRKDMQD